MNSQERDQLTEIVETTNEVIIDDVQYTEVSVVTGDDSGHSGDLGLSEIVVTHVKTQCPECGKYLANVNEHMKLVHLKIR